MVDSYQVIIDNGNNCSSASTDSDTPKLSTILRKNMNEASETSQQQQQQQQQQYEHKQQHSQHQEPTDTTTTTTTTTTPSVPFSSDGNDEMMCGPSPAKHGTNDEQTINVTKTTSTVTTVTDSSSSSSATCIIDNEHNNFGGVAGDNNSVYVQPNYGHDSNSFHNGLTPATDTIKSNSAVTKNSVHAPAAAATAIQANRNCASVTGGGGRNFGAYEVCEIGDDEADADEEEDDDDDDDEEEEEEEEVENDADGDTGTNSTNINYINNNNSSNNNNTATGVARTAVIDAVWHEQRTAHPHHHPYINSNSGGSGGVVNSTIDMESRKVEPLRININREPIKTKIKLGQQPQASSLSPSAASVVKYSTTSIATASTITAEAAAAAASPTQSQSSPSAAAIMPSVSVDSSDEVDEVVSSPHNVVPKITIKPIRPPSSIDASASEQQQQNDDHNANEKNNHRYVHSHNHHHHHHQHHAAQEAIPKLKIKVDSTSSTLQNISSLSATNNISSSSSSSSSSGSGGGGGGGTISSTSISNNNSSCSISQVQNSAGTKEAISLVSDEGVKVTLKPLSEPPLPKLTIKTNTATDMAEVVVMNNTSSVRSDYLTTHTISSSSLSSSYSARNAEDNLSTCSSASASSFSSSSSTAAGTNNDIKLIIKATSTGGSCVVAGDTKKSNKRQATEQSKSVESIVIPKVTIKPVLNPNDGPDACSSEQPSVTPKIILKPIPKPIDKPLEIITAPGSPFSRSGEESQQSPRIILKINKNATSQTTEAILLTKPSSSLASPSVHTSSLVIGSDAQTNLSDAYVASPKSSTTQNALKRSRPMATTNAKKLKLVTESTTDDDDDDDDDEDDEDEDDDEVVHLLSSDSESDMLNHNMDSEASSPVAPMLAIASDAEQQHSKTPLASVENASIPAMPINSDLRSILSRPQLRIPPPLQHFAAQNSGTMATTVALNAAKVTAAPASLAAAVTASTAREENASGKSGDVIDLCHDSNDQLITGMAPRDSNDVTSSHAVGAAIETATPLSSTTENAVSNASDANESSNEHNSQPNAGKTAANNKWSFFYGAEEKRPEPIHPLLQHNIERANVLEAMMNAANSRDKINAANGANNNSTANDNNIEKLSSKRKSELLLDHDGSSSDCIVIEDTGSEPFPFGSNEKATDQNGQKKESMDRDSGVDVSSSVRSTSGDGHDEDVTPVKRPRGRPRKDGTPAGSIKNTTSKKQLKQQQLQLQNDELAKRKFTGVLTSQQNSSAQNVPLPKVILTKMPLNNILASASSSTTSPPSLPIAMHKQQPLFAGQQTTILTASGTMTITSTTAPTIPHALHPQTELTENKISIVPIQPKVSALTDISPKDWTLSDHNCSKVLASPEHSVQVLATSSELSPNNVLVSLGCGSNIAHSAFGEIKPCTATTTTETSTTTMTTETAATTATATTTTSFVAADELSVPTTSLDDTPAIPAKERKRRIIIDDDDESPTFNPLSRSNKRMRGRGRKGRVSLLRQRKLQLLSSPEKATAAVATANATTANAAVTVVGLTGTLSVNENTANVTDSDIFTSPEGIDRRKFLFKDTSNPPTLQVFEEDTRMSADSLFTSPNRNSEFLQNDESQSSLQSSTSATVEGSTKKIRSKIEVADPEGKTEFTVDMIAEYDWPPPKGCCPSRNRDTFMVQEQIAEYLGVKSFKRKYPDLPRRMVEMEERNYLMEKGMVSEKMCDLGLTAVLASDVLDIMHTDFYDKYEEYRRYLRERQIRDLAARHKTAQAGAVGKNLSARENAIRAASSWNSSFNKSRKENRRECLDLQNFVIQIPEAVKTPNRPTTKPSSYPLALVPGQFQEHYRTYSAAELLCYPINTVLADPYQLDRKLREYYNRSHINHMKSESESDSDSDDDSDSDSCSSSDDSSSDSDDSTSSSSDSSSDDEDEEDEKKPDLTEIGDITDVPVAAVVPTKIKRKPIDKNLKGKCKMCDGVQRCNRYGKPELFVRCSICQRDAHPSCIEMPTRMVKRVNEYAWQCSECKHCIKCRRTEDEDKMLFCDQCDRGYHIYCIGLRKVPNGQWHCAVCTVCTMCGARRPEGHNNPNLTPQQKQKLLAVAKWTHEYQLNPVTKASEHSSMLCTSCVAIKHSAAKTIFFT